MTAADAMWCAIGLLALAGSFMCSGLELGCYTLSRVRLSIRADRRPPDRAARILRSELERPERVLATLLITNSIFNAIFAKAGSELFLHSDDQTAGVIGASLALAAIQIILGESLPKELFRLEADRWTYHFAGPIRLVRVLLTGIGALPLTSLASRAAERIGGLAGQGRSISDARQRMAELIKEGGLGGVLSESQSSLLDRALLLKEMLVEDEMVPWASARTVSADWDRARVVEYAVRQLNSRLPVVDSRGRVVGIVRQIDLYTRPSALVSDLMREPARLSPTMPVLEALPLVRASRARFGVVERDGKPVGLVTVRDLVESLTGDLPDL